MEKEEIKKQENNEAENNKKLNTDTALKIMAGLIVFIVIFLLLMRYTEKNGISENKVEFITAEGTIAEAVSEETVPEQDSEETVPEPASGKTQKININTADKNELIKIPGIGEKKAEAIIEYRKQYGYFYKPEEIMNISGIKEKTFEKLKDYITTE